MPKIVWHTPIMASGGGKRYPTPEWPEGWPLPREGEAVETGSQTLYVKHVIYYPWGNRDEGDSEPFIYIVLSVSR